MTNPEIMFEIVSCAAKPMASEPTLSKGQQTRNVLSKMVEHNDHRDHCNKDINKAIDERCKGKVEIRRFLCGDGSGAHAG